MSRGSSQTSNVRSTIGTAPERSTMLMLSDKVVHHPDLIIRAGRYGDRLHADGHRCREGESADAHIEDLERVVRRIDDKELGPVGGIGRPGVRARSRRQQTKILQRQDQTRPEENEEHQKKWRLAPNPNIKINLQQAGSSKAPASSLVRDGDASSRPALQRFSTIYVSFA
jgi:hypothetical protein